MPNASVCQGSQGSGDRSRSLVLVASMLLALAGRGAVAEDLVLNTLETRDLQLLYFDPQQTYLVPHVARSFHNSLAFQEKIFDWAPWNPQTFILLKDFADYGNAAATASPVNIVLLDVAPPSHAFETLPGSDRFYSAMNHELVHVVQGDVWNSTDAFWRRLFGGKVAVNSAHPESLIYHYLTTPRAVSPRWLSEGVAVFQETWMSGGIGRAQGAYDEMVFRAMVRDNAHFYSNLGLVAEGTHVDFQVGANAYLYGTRFVSYLAYTYSPQHVIDWIKRDEGSERYYAKQFRRVFGKDMETAWNEWVAWEHQFQRANLEKVRAHPLTPAQPVTRHTLGSISRSFVDQEQNAMVGGFRYPGVVAHVGAVSLDDGSLQRYVDISGPMLYQVTSAAFDPQRRQFFYTGDNTKIRDLMVLDLATGKARMLIRDARIGDLAFNRNDSSLWGLRHLNGYVTLVRLEPPYTEWRQVHTWPYGEVPFELDVSADGSRISMSMEKLDGSQRLQVYATRELLDGKSEPLASVSFGSAIPEGFVFTADGRYLYGSSYYTGISNIFRYELATGDLEVVSNAETGFFRPIPLADGRLLVYEFTGTGFVPSIINPEPLQDVSAITFLGTEVVEKHPEVKQWAVGSPARVPLQSLVTHEGTYHPLKEMNLSSYPIIQGYRGGTVLGWNWELADPILFNRLSANIGAGLDGEDDGNQWFHANLEYQMLDWRVQYWHNYADFYDLFGPTERSLKGDGYLLGYGKRFPGKIDLDATVEWYNGLDTVPGNQNVDADFKKLFSANLDLESQHTSKSLGAVDHEKGYIWNLGLTRDDASVGAASKFHAGFDFGFALPIHNSSIWLYNAAGAIDGDRDNTLANWYFGAFGNNYVDDREVKRYRDYERMPGFDIDEIAGQTFGRSMLEWNITPLYFEEVGKPGFYLSWMRSAVFAGALVTDIGNDRYEQTYSSVGLQVDFGFTFAHRMPLVLSLGFGQGFVDSDKAGNEWLFSLKIL
ncbi:YncE family protein [Haliea sp. E17]|uniref:YncE family protein n=1 Tax=Haliea sp. E17 TaxID=3401576 RepID=UPI003AB063D0